MAPLLSPGSLQDVLEEWLTCQSSWLYLEPIFSSDDIMEQLPVEGKRYQHMENTWRRIMKSAFHKRKVGPRRQDWVGRAAANYACVFCAFRSSNCVPMLVFWTS